MLPTIELSDLQIPTYFLFISLIVVFEIFYLLRRTKQFALDSKVGLDLFLAAIIGGFLGARLLHVFYEEPYIYKAHPLNVLYFWNGGFVYYGGFLAGFACATLLALFKKQNFFKWADLSTPLISSAYLLGRLGCFLNGCCYGKVCELPWALATADGILRHPTALYAAGLEAFCFVGVLLLERKKILSTGSLFLFWLMGHSASRILVEYFREDFRGPLLLGLSVSSVISVCLLAVSAGVWLLRGKITK